MDKLSDVAYANAVRTGDGDYVWPNGVVLLNPDVRQPCEVVLTNGVQHSYPTQGRILDYTRSEMAKPPGERMPARARAVCNGCRWTEGALDEKQQRGRAVRKAAAAAPPAEVSSPRSLSDVLAAADALLEENGSTAA